jgi:hypothetical protein
MVQTQMPNDTEINAAGIRVRASIACKSIPLGVYSYFLRFLDILLLSANPHGLTFVESLRGLVPRVL